MEVVKTFFAIRPVAVSRRVMRRALLLLAVILAEYYGLPSTYVSRDTLWGCLSLFKCRWGGEARGIESFHKEIK